MTAKQPVRLFDLFRFYKQLPHQMAAITELETALLKTDPGLLNKDQPWFKTWSQSGKQVELSDNSWKGVCNAAQLAGAKFPELVAAQWALESGWGKHLSGKHNYFGLKGDGTNKQTQEYINNQWITITDSFIDFPDLRSCVEYLVSRWYKNWKNYQGVNNAANRNAAAQMLVTQGYATDPTYAQKLIKLMDQLAAGPSLFTPSSSFDTKITPHITYGEICLNENRRRFLNQGQCNICIELCNFIEKARTHFGGKSVIITSGHRPAAVNQEVGGATDSEHLYKTNCGAIDWYIQGVSVETVQDWCDKNWPYSLGYGAPKGFIHLGIRSGKQKIRWDY
jgi:hypothetical protein